MFAENYFPKLRINNIDLSCYNYTNLNHIMLYVAAVTINHSELIYIVLSLSLTLSLSLSLSPSLSLSLTLSLSPSLSPSLPPSSSKPTSRRSSPARPFKASPTRAQSGNHPRERTKSKSPSPYLKNSKSRSPPSRSPPPPRRLAPPSYSVGCNDYHIWKCAYG